MTTRQRARAFAGGVAGAAAMMAAARLLGSPVMNDLSRLSGSMLFEPRTSASRVAGATMQLLNGGLLAQGYLELTRRFPDTHRTWRTGLAAGVMHGVAAGMFLGIVPAVHPRVPDTLPRPGLFLSRRGARGAANLIILHALYGAIVVALIGRGKRGRRPGMRSGGDISPISHAR